MKMIAVFGGSGGLGQKLVPLLKERYDVISLSSKVVNITRPDEVADFFEQNDVDIVLNMSGKKHDAFLSAIQEDEWQSIQDMLDVNINGGINILRYCLPQMIKKKYGRVIFLSSIFAELNVPRNGLYCASKAFIERLIGTANRENIKYGITCNTLQLGYWDGGMCYQIEQKYQDMAKQKIGLKRWGSIQELYAAIQFLVDTEYACGINLKLGGGV